MASKIKGLGDAVERYIQGCGKFQQAVEGWQAGNVSRYEDGLIDSAIKVGSALELSLKIYLKHVSGDQLNRDEQDVVYGKANFADMLRLMKRHATPPLGDDLSRHLLDYRDMRNQAEHHGAVPRMGDLQAACETLGQLMLDYLPLEDRERRRIQHVAASLQELSRRVYGKSTGDNEQRVFYRFPSATLEAATLDGIRNSLSEIHAYLQGVAIPELTIEDGLIAAQAPAVPALLRERQTVVLERHTLLAGREGQLAQIRDFLANQSKGHIFVTGPSGYGKSALLANLIASSPDRFIWHFLNRLDGTHTRTAFLRSMVEQILAYYRMPIRSEVDLPTADDRLEALYSKLLRMPLVRANRPFILVIDGIDEAENDFIRELHIPRSLPEGKFIVFSGRATGQDYLRQLGVPGTQTLTVSLDRMDAAAIRSMLSQAGGAATSLVNDLPLVHQIARVSGGDPFYLRFMVGDIAAGVISSDMLAKQPAGLEHYLDGWWRQIAEPVRSERGLRDLLGILMVAPGPVPEQDLLQMAPELEWSLDVILPPVRRFLTVGQLGEQPIYSLCHRRFQQYLADHKLKNQVMIYRERLIDHCAQWREHRSAFVLNHYTSLLAQLERWDDLHELVVKVTGDKQEWVEARRQADGNYVGYLRDLQLSWDHLGSVEDGSAIGRQVRYALVRSTLVTIIKNTPPNLVAALVKLGYPGWTVDRALGYVMNYPDDATRVRGVLAVVPYLSVPSLSDALKTLRQESSNRNFERLLNHLCEELPESSRQIVSIAATEIGLDVTRSPDRYDWLLDTSDVERSMIFGSLTEDGAPESSQQIDTVAATEQAFEIIETLCMHPLDRYWNAGRDDQALLEEFAQLAMQVPAQEVGTILDRTRLIDEPSIRIRAVDSLAPRMTSQLLPKALDIVQVVDDHQTICKTLVKLASGLPFEERNRHVKHVLEDLVPRIRDPKTAVEVLGAIIPLLTQDELVVADRIVRKCPDEYWQAYGLHSLVPFVPIDHARNILKHVADHLRDRDHYLEFATHTPVGWLDDAPATVVLGYIDPGIVRLEPAFVDLITSLPPDLADCALIETIALSLEEGNGPGTRAKALLAFCVLLPETKRDSVLGEIIYTSIERWTTDVHYNEFDPEAVAVLARHLSKKLMSRVVNDMLEAHAREWWPEGSISLLISALAPHLPPDLVVEVFDLAKRLRSESEKCSALTSLLSYLPNTNKQEAIMLVLEVMSAPDVGHDRSEIPSRPCGHAVTSQTNTPYLLLSSALHSISDQTRSEFLRDLQALTSILVEMGDSDIVDEVVGSVLDITKLWP